MSELGKRIAGGLAGALLGDAMGSVTEMLTPRQIKERYGRVDTLLSPEEGTFASGRVAGQLTDDGLLTLAVIDGLLQHGGSLTARHAAQMLVEWANDPEVFDRFAGPSSRKAILALRRGESPEDAGAPSLMTNDLRISNGAAMKVAPAGWFCPGQIEAAVRLAGSICVPTHNSHIAFAGAGSVAAAVAVAASGEDMEDVLTAAVRGAELGEQEGIKRAVEVPAPSMAARVRLAIDVAHEPGDVPHRIARLTDLIGSGLPITEAVPMAIGINAVIPDDPMELIRTLVNIGSDADTVASIAGAIAGTSSGLKGFDADMLAQLEDTNGIDIGQIAERVANTAMLHTQEES